MAVLGHVASHERDVRRQMRQEIVTDEETHKDPVIQRTLQVKSERLIRHAHLDGKVFSEDADMQPDERLRRLLYTFLLLWRTTALVCNMSRLIALAAVTRFGVVGEYILTEDPEMSIVRFYICKAVYRDSNQTEERDNIEAYRARRKRCVNHLPCVGVVRGTAALRPHEIHNLMFTLTWDSGIGDDDFQLFPSGVGTKLVAHPVPQTLCQKVHEGRARSNGIGIPGLFRLLWILAAAVLGDGALGKHFTRNRRERCWFILARGATPSTAIISSLRGRTMFTTRSVYSKMAIIISSSLAGGGRSSGCEQGWTIPFISKYRLSISSPLGLGFRPSTGILVLLPSAFSNSSGRSSSTGEIILGKDATVGVGVLCRGRPAGNRVAGGVEWSLGLSAARSRSSDRSAPAGRVDRAAGVYLQVSRRQRLRSVGIGRLCSARDVSQLSSFWMPETDPDA
ncbi:hypothetical protein KC342_g88 [Hortaea werneckii]|nr:hypothetical protein KC342_g88 [Hortaea werneckii]